MTAKLCLSRSEGDAGKDHIGIMSITRSSVKACRTIYEVSRRPTSSPPLLLKLQTQKLAPGAFALLALAVQKNVGRGGGIYERRLHTPQPAFSLSQIQ